MTEVSIIGLDLAKNVFQAHGAAADGSVVFRRRLSRGQLLKFFTTQPPCLVAIEACASAHHWARTIRALGHTVRLIPPAYVKPFVKRQKTDVADAEAIAEAAARPTMRFVEPKSEEQQAAAMAYRTRDLLVRQRTQTINALRAHLAEYGVVAPTGVAHVGRLAAILEESDSGLPEAVMALGRMLVAQISALNGQIETLDKELRQRASGDDATRRLMTIPGVGAITATALTTFAPPSETFAKGRDFAAWVSLTPRQPNQLPDEAPPSAGKRNGPDLHISIQARGEQGRIFEAGHTTAPDHMLDRCQETACIRGGVHTRPVGKARRLLQCSRAAGRRYA